MLERASYVHFFRNEEFAGTKLVIKTASIAQLDEQQLVKSSSNRQLQIQGTTLATLPCHRVFLGRWEYFAAQVRGRAPETSAAIRNVLLCTGIGHFICDASIFPAKSLKVFIWRATSHRLTACSSFCTALQ